MESPRLAAQRALLHGLDVSVAAGGLVAFVAWLFFRFGPAALVAGAAWIASGFLTLLSRRSPTLGLTHRPAARGALLHAHGALLLLVGGLLLRSGIQR